MASTYTLIHLLRAKPETSWLVAQAIELQRPTPYMHAPQTGTSGTTDRTGANPQLKTEQWCSRGRNPVHYQAVLILHSPTATRP